MVEYEKEEEKEAKNEERKKMTRKMREDSFSPGFHILAYLGFTRGQVGSRNSLKRHCVLPENVPHSPATPDCTPYPGLYTRVQSLAAVVEARVIRGTPGKTQPTAH